MQLQRCCHCDGRFGLVSHRFLFKRLCSRQCLGGHKRNLAAMIEERVSRWCVLLTSIAFGKGRTAAVGAERRYARISHSPIGVIRRHG